MKKPGKMLSSLIATALLITTVQTASLAENVNTVGTSETGLVTYSEDFESYTANATWASKTAGLGFYNGGSSSNKMVVRGNKSLYPEIQTSVTTGSPYMIFKLNDADYKTNLIADAKKYTVEFDLKVFPETVSKTMYLYLGSAYGLYLNASKTTYSISALAASGNDKIAAEEGATTTYTGLSDTKFVNYKIEVDKENAVTSLWINDSLVFKDVPQRGENSFEELKVNPQKMIGKYGIDNLKVTVTDESVCSDANWAENSTINFEDFTVGNIFPSATALTGGFNNKHTDKNDFYSMINYSYDSEDITAVNKYLTVTKTTAGDGARSIKRDITNVIADSSVYDLSFNIKNELTKNTALIKIGDGSSSAGGAVLEFGAYGTVNYLDYSKESPITNIPSLTMTNGEWIPIKFRIYKNENKADLYFSDMNTPVVTGFTMNQQYGGGTFVASPQNSSTGSVSIDDIKVTSVEQDDYVLTYYAGSSDMSKYISGTIAAECVAAQGKELPVAIIAEYDADGKLVNTAISSLKDGSENTVRAELENPSVAEGETVKIMLWNSMNIQKPIKRSVTLTPIAATE